MKNCARYVLFSYVFLLAMDEHAIHIECSDINHGVHSIVPSHRTFVNTLRCKVLSRSEQRAKTSLLSFTRSVTASSG